MDKDIALVVGLDLGDRRSAVHMIRQEDGALVRRGFLATTVAGLDMVLGPLPRALVVMETGTHSPWVQRHVAALGHRPLVVNAREVSFIFRSARKEDRVDAEKLARLGRMDPSMLQGVQHRGEQAQRDMAMLRARAALVSSRTKLINSARGMTKSLGERIRRSSSTAFPVRASADLREETLLALRPTMDAVSHLSGSIRMYDRAVSRLCAERYPQTRRLTQVAGVGDLLALSFVLAVGDPGRFRRARDVGAYLGLVPRRDQSGGRDRQLGITKTGDRLVRQLLVQAAHYILGHFGPDTVLRRWGLLQCQRGGPIARNKARVAIARKLAVVLLHLWVSGAAYRPLPEAEPRLRA